MDARSAKLMSLITAFMASRAVQVAAELGLADLLAEGARSAEELAAPAGAHAPSLHRLLRALAGLGIVDEESPGRFALTAEGAALRSGVEGSLRHFAMMSGTERTWRCWSALVHSIRTGETAMRHVYGMGSFAYFAAHPDEAAVFNAAMAESTRRTARAVAAAYDFSRFRRLIDVGGGNGTLIAAILAVAPGLSGVLFDLPGGNADAPPLLAAAGLAQRCEIVAGDFFRAIPTGVDACILKSVIHDWDDERAAVILGNCRKSLLPDGTLLLIERVMPTRMDASPSHRSAALLDLHMLALPGGRERTGAECEALLAAGGFALRRILPVPATDVSLIEAAPA